ncbi:hypothetical protein MMC25_006750 [Agyrium rufum]|nr:hypothetical protein [Agyrium rufum]
MEGSAYPPPPPPPLPPVQDPQSSTDGNQNPPITLKTCEPPPGTFKAGTSIDRRPAPIGPYFFYGSLMDPDLLTEILNLKELPKLRAAYTSGYATKLWGQYPALVEDTKTSARIEGVMFDVECMQVGERLAEYETGNYLAKPCLITYVNDGVTTFFDGYTFVFVGNPRDLSEGSFDLQLWLKRIGRGKAVDSLNALKASR